jgi:hypothetical protein
MDFSCHAKFQSASRLRQHERLHEDRGGFYECHVCKERLVRKKGLKKHLALHSKQETEAAASAASLEPPASAESARIPAEVDFLAGYPV